MRLLSLCLLGTCGAAASAAPLDPADFEKLHSLMQPTREESRWLQIPWRPNLWEARREAAAAGKPIYLWEMDGHPLGCT